MPDYEFMFPDGRIVTKKCPSSGPDYPDEGEHMILDPDTGQMAKAKRIMSVPANPTSVWKPYISDRLPRHMHGQPCTPDGKVIVRTQAQERDIMAQGGYERE